MHEPRPHRTRTQRRSSPCAEVPRHIRSCIEGRGGPRMRMRLCGAVWIAHNTLLLPPIIPTPIPLTPRYVTCIPEYVLLQPFPRGSPPVRQTAACWPLDDAHGGLKRGGQGCGRGMDGVWHGEGVSATRESKQGRQKIHTCGWLSAQCPFPFPFPSHPRLHRHHHRLLSHTRREPRSCSGGWCCQITDSQMSVN